METECKHWQAGHGYQLQSGGLRRSQAHEEYDDTDMGPTGLRALWQASWDGR